MKEVYNFFGYLCRKRIKQKLITSSSHMSPPNLVSRRITLVRPVIRYIEESIEEQQRDRLLDLSHAPSIILVIYFLGNQMNYSKIARNVFIVLVKFMMVKYA